MLLHPRVQSTLTSFVHSSVGHALSTAILSQLLLLRLRLQLALTQARRWRWQLTCCTPYLFSRLPNLFGQPAYPDLSFFHGVSNNLIFRRNSARIWHLSLLRPPKDQELRSGGSISAFLRSCTHACLWNPSHRQTSSNRSSLSSCGSPDSKAPLSTQSPKSSRALSGHTTVARTLSVLL